MEISAQAIQTVGGQSGPLQSFVAGLKPGDTLTAQVLGRTPAGLAVLALAGKQVQLPLPQQFLPGSILTLTVQQGSNGLQFAIQPQAGQAGAAPSQAAQASQLASQPAAPPVSQSPANPPAPATVRATAPPPAPPANAPLPPLVNARTGLPVPASPAATPGQAVTARILATPTPTTAIVSLGNQELPISLPRPLAPGSQLALVVQRGPDGLQLAHAPAQGGAQPSAAPAPAASQPAGSAPVPVAAPTTPQTQNTNVPGLVTPATPAAALTQATLASLGNQNSLAVLLTSILRLGDKTRNLPEDVQRALGRLTQAVLSLDGKAPDAAALQRAIARSGLFLESQLAAGRGATQLQGDLKALLLTVQRALGNWLGPDAQSAVLLAKQPPPPQPGAMPRAAPPAAAALAADASPEDIGKALLSQTDAALSRLRLHQMASLPDRPEAPSARQDIRMEIPVTIGQQPGILSLVISPDDDDQDAEKKKKKGWRVQFAVNASVIGEVGAEIGLLGERTNVVLSAAEPEAAEALEADIAELSEALEAVGLTPGVLRVRRIAAPPPKSGFQQAENNSGKLLDRDT